MTTGVLLLVLGAAALHAAWNYVAKTVGGGIAFAWFFALADLAVAVPLGVVALAVVGPPERPLAAVLLMAGSGVLHAGYFALLQRAYRHGDLSLVYPLARGTAPLLAMVVAIAALGERPSALALGGAAVLVVAILSIGVPSARRLDGRLEPGTGYALATGAVIAVYTLWDKYAVDDAAISPLVYYLGSAIARALIFAPFARRRPEARRRIWREHRARVVAAGAIASVAYILVLLALSVAPVSYVAPAREVSVLIGAALGIQLLSERDARRRLLCATAVVIGIACLGAG